MDTLKIAERNCNYALEVLDRTGLITAWEKIGATVNIVGSLKSGLMIKNMDIDLHIYTDKVDIGESFSVMQKLAESLSLREINYINLIDTEEECIEWHTRYEDWNGKIWKFDMIHIRKGSKYDGVVERTTEGIIRKLTPELKRTILQIKSDIPSGESIPGIEIYIGVFSGDVRNYEDLQEWRRSHPLTMSDTLGWLP
ncbi:MAG: nucleotidyltransferase domain-containing protein [Bacteroidales bacterium]|nr:nucleotidyltransferase domain-containing protein [Bacteroidales bacterium]